MSRKWNGNLLDNNHSGDSFVTIVMEIAAIPCAIVTTIGLLWLVYASGFGWPHYALALIGGPIVGLFVATAVAFGVLVLLATLAFVALPFKMGYDRAVELRK